MALFSPSQAPTPPHPRTIPPLSPHTSRHHGRVAPAVSACSPTARVLRRARARPMSCPPHNPFFSPLPRHHARARRIFSCGAFSTPISGHASSTLPAHVLQCALFPCSSARHLAGGEKWPLPPPPRRPPRHTRAPPRHSPCTPPATMDALPLPYLHALSLRACCAVPANSL